MLRKLLLMITLLTAGGLAASAQAASRRDFSWFKVATCSGATCLIPLITVPNKQIYEIKSASCMITINGASSLINELSITADKDPIIAGKLYMQPVKMMVDSSNVSTFSANASGYIRASAGTVLTVGVSSAGSGAMFELFRCNIGGTRIKLD